MGNKDSTLLSEGRTELPGSLAVSIPEAALGISEGRISGAFILPPTTPHKKAQMFSVSLLRGGLPGPSLSGASPTLALTPQCGLDVATVPYKPQCAAGAGAGPGWVESMGRGCEDPGTQSRDIDKAHKANVAPRGVGENKKRGPMGRARSGDKTGAIFPLQELCSGDP